MDCPCSCIPQIARHDPAKGLQYDFKPARDYAPERTLIKSIITQTVAATRLVLHHNQSCISSSEKEVLAAPFAHGFPALSVASVGYQNRLSDTESVYSARLSFSTCVSTKRKCSRWLWRKASCGGLGMVAMPV